MAAKTSSTKNRRKTVPKSKPRAKTRVVASKRSRLTSRPLAIVAAFLFGAAGIYLLLQSGALASDEVLLPDQPERGLVYQGKKIKTKGPCAGEFDMTTDEDREKNAKTGKDIRRCGHIDPTPPGVDIRERVKHVEADLAKLAAHDEKYAPAKSDDTSGYEQPTLIEEAATITAASMSGLPGRDWPCLGDGKAGERVELIYVYPAGGDNRLSSLRSGFNGIIRRVNQIFAASGDESGNAHQVRFVTNNGDPGCSLKISAEGIRGDQLDNEDFIKDRLEERGYKGIPMKFDITGDGVPDITQYEDRKYIIWIDKKITNDRGQIIKCGLGEKAVDDSPDKNNANNTNVSHSWVWKGCWNYAEPHELMHMLGGVQRRVVIDGKVYADGAPHATNGGHCYDERDAMCYDDDGNGPVTMRNICTRAIDWWRLDCNHNDYYRGNDPANGYLSNHWNTANSDFLTP